VFGYETGAAMTSGTAAGKRVGFFLDTGTASALNSNAALLFDAAVQWGANTIPKVTYLRDVTDRIVQRSVNGVVAAKYSYSATGDTADLTLDAAGNVAEVTTSLTGGAIRTARAGGDVWSYPNIHGDVVATANVAGAKQGGTRAFDPFGNPLGTSTIPDNSAGSMDYGWHGEQQRPLENQAGIASVIEMGARQYSPLLGRFLEVDPVAGGNANDYVYVWNPIGMSDLDGNWGWSWKDIRKFGRNVAKRGYQAGRFARNMATGATGVGMVYAAVRGARCGFNRQELMFACTGARRFNTRGGTTIGGVFVTHQATVSPQLMRHEGKHADQWAALGWAMPGMYVQQEISRRISGGSEGCNIFERAAGLKDGNYGACR
jgi:RHS repeat-associated protein